MVCGEACATPVEGERRNGFGTSTTRIRPCHHSTYQRTRPDRPLVRWLRVWWGAFYDPDDMSRGEQAMSHHTQAHEAIPVRSG